MILRRCLPDISLETRAVMKNVFSHVQEYVKSSKSGIIPFESFKIIVDKEYKESYSELILLKNN
jgi:hypothetical protein